MSESNYLTVTEMEDVTRVLNTLNTLFGYTVSLSDNIEIFDANGDSLGYAVFYTAGEGYCFRGRGV